MELFYADAAALNLTERRILLSGEEFHHAVKVFRKRTGDTVMMTDGGGTCYTCEIEVIEKSSLTARITHTDTDPPPQTRISIAISLLRLPDRFDFFLEKATELGVSEIIPMITEHTVSTPKQSQYAVKEARWRKLVLAASKQSHQFRFPVVSPITPFAEVLKRDEEVKVIPYEYSEAHPALSFAGKRVLFLIGGEGGFSEAEVAAAKGAGFIELSLGKKILRGETAGILAASLVRAEELHLAARLT